MEITLMDKDRLIEKYNMDGWDGDFEGSEIGHYVDSQLDDYIRIGMTFRKHTDDEILILCDKSYFQECIDETVCIDELQRKINYRKYNDDDYLEYYWDNFSEVFFNVGVEFEDLYINAYDEIFEYLTETKKI